MVRNECVGASPCGERIPVRGEIRIVDRLDAVLRELALQLSGGVVGEADVGVGKRLIENRARR